MFSLFEGLYDSFLAPAELNLVIVGVPGSGKTALLERLKVTKVPSRPPPPSKKQHAYRVGGAFFVGVRQGRGDFSQLRADAKFHQRHLTRVPQILIEIVAKRFASRSSARWRSGIRQEHQADLRADHEEW